MSTTTSGPLSPARSEHADTTPGSSPRSWLLILLVFTAGAASLGVEMAASRLLAPYFGTSLFVWANLIGLILLYLTAGYYFGGRVADRFPRPQVLYLLTCIAAFLIGLIPWLSRPILAWSLSAFATYSVSIFYGSLAAVILLFALPTILLGSVSPFAIRLLVDQVGHSGRTAGKLYAISTAGSILGTFIPVLWLIPTFGTYRTLFTIAIVLLVVSLIALLATRGNTAASEAPTIMPRSRQRQALNLLPILLLLPLGLEYFTLNGPIKPPSGTNGGGVMVDERESAYNYIQVVRVGDEMQLVLNEGLAVHSIYNPHQALSNGEWDYFMVGPYFNRPPFSASQVRRVAVIGLGAGTIPHEFTEAYGPIPIDGVELDSAIVDVGRKYFNMNEPNLNVVVQDGRYFLRTTQQKYDEIGIDAYQQPYIPFQLTSTEFFGEVKAHLTPTGVAVINAGHTNKDYRLVEALAQTMHTVFSNVYIIDTARFENSLIVGTNAPTSLGNFQINANALTNPLLQEVAQSSLTYGNIREEKRKYAYFTDDQAPIEQLINQIILDAVRTGNS